MSNHTTSVIPQVAEYFGTTELPVITQAFTPGKGWKLCTHKRPLSRAWLRRLKKEGVTRVTLTLGQRSPDFAVEELLKPDRRPLLTGNLIGAAVKL